MVIVKSSNIHSIEWRPNVLDVIYNHDLHTIYRYLGVQKHEYVEIINAKSIGKALHALVKLKNYNFDKIAITEAVPSATPTS